MTYTGNLHFQVPVTSQTDVAVNASFCHIEPTEEADLSPTVLRTLFTLTKKDTNANMKYKYKYKYK